MEAIATIHTGFHSKFGVPRQSGLTSSIKGTIVFKPEFRDRNALRGLEEFSHIWLIWEFSQARRDEWSPTVRPPRLGGNVRMGVFATRSPFRPNPIGLSCVRLEGIDMNCPDGPVIHVSGADMVDGTPIYDIKPYIPYTDCQPQATGGFTDNVEMHVLDVEIGSTLTHGMPADTLQAIKDILAQDPRPRYQQDSERIYSFEYDGWNIHFNVDGNRATVESMTKAKTTNHNEPN
ncbi:MAG: tRNA (N6-threonylcarbamoyladenosine(37)-N6)-methyltransferase TrmO [Bacteroidaceae bacterium]|nr:tRNA (N6-threonylcarbamoyladenosine(37)-N6)-methyltransferase TrmO [Bacteroidaceae bacterium]